MSIGETDPRWLVIRDPGINADGVAAQIRERLAGRTLEQAEPEAENACRVADALWERMIGDSSDVRVPIEQRDCDIIPRDYTIDWRVPILGPLNALVRRVINAEIRRYLMPALERQSYLNREFLRTLIDLREQNDRLQRRIEELRHDDREGPGR